MVAVAADADGEELAAIRLTGADPYSFTGRILAWAAGKAAADGVRSADGTPLAGALGPVEAFGIAPLEAACAEAGFRAGGPKSPSPGRNSRSAADAGA